MACLKYPKKQSISFSNKILDLYGKAKQSKDDEITFDLSSTVSLSPFGILMVSVTIIECLNLGKKCAYIGPKNSNLKRKLREFGFNNLFNLPEKCDPRDLITHGRILLKKLDGLNPIFLETFSGILDYHLKISKELKWSLKMAMSEATQNVVQHSGGASYYVCSWLYPRERQLRVCIADMGRGILKALNLSPYYDLKNHYEAIRLATEEGVTSKAKKAGLGLHHIKGFLEVNEGQLCIISGEGKVFWDFSRGTIKDQSMEHYFSGTILKLAINTGKENRYSLSSEEDPIF